MTHYDAHIVLFISSVTWIYQIIIHGYVKLLTDCNVILCSIVTDMVEHGMSYYHSSIYWIKSIILK